MKERSIKSVLVLRYNFSIIFYVSLVVYGAISILSYGKNDVGLVYSCVAVLASLIAIVSILIKSEALVKETDPLNKYNNIKYIFIIILEVTEFIAVYFLSVTTSKDKRNIMVIVFCVIATVCCFFIRLIHKSIYVKYENMIKNGEINKILLDYSNASNGDVDINWYYKRFGYFMLYIIALIFVYKYTLYYWALTVGFVLFNAYIMWKIHWKGIENFVKCSKIYFCITILISTIGIILLKNIYDGNIVLTMFKNRDEYEYYMVLVLFYLPIIYYGKKVAVLYSKKTCRWVE